MTTSFSDVIGLLPLINNILQLQIKTVPTMIVQSLLCVAMFTNSHAKGRAEPKLGYLAMLMIQIESTPGIINGAVLSSLYAQAQLCFCQVAQGSGLGPLALSDGHHQGGVGSSVASHLPGVAKQ